MTAPIVITKGGLYQGAWTSTDPTVPAVTLATREPVTLQGSTTAPGVHIADNAGNVTLTLLAGFAGHGTAPPAGVAPGRFMALWQPAILSAIQCSLTGTTGIQIQGGGVAVPMTLAVQRWTVSNLDGRLGDGKGGRQGVATIANFLQLNGVINPALDASWNQVINAPGQSATEDLVSFVNTSSSTGDILLHDNYLFGSYAPDPANGSSSGSCVMVEGASAGIIILNNQALQAQVGYGIAGGSATLTGNRAVSSGLLPNGQRIASSNVGIYCTSPSGVVTGNYAAWMNAAGQQNPFWLPAGTLSNNTSGGVATVASEQAEFTAWLAKLHAKFGGAVPINRN